MQAPNSTASNEGWREPIGHWRTDAIPLADLRRLERAELLARWPAEPFETAATDCLAIDGEYWIRQPGVGTLRFTAERAEFTAFQAAGVSPEWFAHLVTRSWLPAIYPAWGRQVLHASAALQNATGSVLAFSGPSHAGKSTLAYSLSRRPNWRHLADDTLAFSCTSNGIALHPLRNEARLRPPTAAHYQIGAPAPAPLDWPGYVPTLQRIYILDGLPLPSGRITIARLTGSESYQILLSQAHAFTLEVPAFNRRIMHDYLTLVANVGIFRLSYPKTFEALDDLCVAIERHAPG
jgi:hypothetical protein